MDPQGGQDGDVEEQGNQDYQQGANLSMEPVEVPV